MRFVGAVLTAATLLGSSQPPSASAQVPQIPATFYGSATIDGKAPPPGTAVRGLINGVDCTQPGAMGTVDAGEVGAYVISVMHESQKPGCGREGKRVTFIIGGREAGQAADWSAGPRQLDLNAGTGRPQPLPSDVAIPTPIGAAGSGTGPGGSVPPTDDVQLPRGTPRGSTPLPPGVSTDENGAASNVGAVLVAALAGLGLTGGATGWALSRRRREDGPGDGSPGSGGDGNA